MKRIFNIIIIICFYSSAYSQIEVSKKKKQDPSDFSLVSLNSNALIYNDANDYKVVRIASGLFSKDIDKVTGKWPIVVVNPVPTGDEIVIIGTIGKCGLVDKLGQKGLIPVDSIKGRWERYLIQTVENPFPGVKKALVIAGSDARGTAYGVFTVSKAIGVSPWYWWADVTPEKSECLSVKTVSYISKSPSVKYRGFFINDEDWGMQPWAAKMMDKDIADIGPRTYEKVFELMLRLKANYLWPAMHPCTKAFWYYKENPEVARNYAIVMGSSHHEPMLRDTEWEWNMNYKEEYGKDHGYWRYDINKDEIYRFFDDRVKEAVDNDAIYTLGMRATKDGPMSGPQTVEGKIEILEDVINDQREILKKRLDKEVSEVPQMFCPYKEVLELYKAGLEVPEDVTILWPDDNFGNIRQLPNEKEQQRIGGNGIYYHFSYWGIPQDYLWLCSISPAMISSEMSKAYEFNAREIWVFNVGDIKPAELELDLGMELAWDINSWTPEKAHLYTKHWATKIFGEKFAKEIADIKDKYYLLAASGRPEHMDEIHLTPEEALQRVKEYQNLKDKALKVGTKIPEHLKDAYFELISYPVQGACYMNEKLLYARESLRLASLGDEDALEYSQKAIQAYNNIQIITEQYNKGIAGGKWDAMINARPRDRKVYNMPKVATAEMIGNVTIDEKTELSTLISVKKAGEFKMVSNDNLTLLEGLGVSGQSLAVLPVDLAVYDDENLVHAPYADYQLDVKKGKNNIKVKCLSNFSINPETKLRYALVIEDKDPVFVDLSKQAETKKWEADVIKCYAEGRTIYESSEDKKIKVRIYFVDPGLVLNEVSSIAF